MPANSFSTSTADAESQAKGEHSVFEAGGELGSLMRRFDWSKTPLGPVAEWPQSLKTTVSICLASRFPIVLYWGPELVVLYNDAYIPILGSKHPWALGQTCRVCWAEIWDAIGPMLDGVLRTGEATWSDDLLLMLRRFGYPEECYFSFSFSPVRAENGAVGGIFTAVIETTEKVIGERRLRTLRDLAARSVAAKNAQDGWQIAADTLGENPDDVPFAILCEATSRGYRVAGTAGIPSGHPLCAALCDPESDLFRRAAEVVRSGRRAELEDLAAFADVLPCGSWETPPQAAAILPIAALGQESAGFLFAALSPAKRLDESYRTFLDLMARQIATSIADARAYDEERRQAESLAALDRAKTVFFSNISHELRTPLTLLLGPTEAALAAPEGALRGAELEKVHRNELRLLKLVNTLLDFSRIEAGRVQAVYEAADLCTLTTEIASVFRSAIEKAGLRFTVECEVLNEPVFVDREMWEKIVLNLLSNAFKFTFDGEIAVRLRAVDGAAELSVADTGIGIQEEELGRVFERFHRIENARARTHEGTGIGLALVQELARLHGGSVRVESEVERGSTFRVTIPLGREHLPADRIGARRALASTALGAETFAEEAQRWLPGESGAEAASDELAMLPSQAAGLDAGDAVRRDRIVVADDNADMREYVTHLLSPEYSVHAVTDGVEALEAAVRLHPALILTDIMMPRLDGFGVLRAIRNDAALSSIPVILLSARAGEESQVEGLDAGADDYLVKPFTARELLARVGAHIRMANLRRQAAEREAQLLAAAELERLRLREILEHSPAAVGLLHGPEHRWVFVNDFYVRVTGRNSAQDFLGKTLRESLPELEGQGYLELLDQVFRTGEPFVGREAKAELRRGADGQMQRAYFNFVYQPMRNAEGAVEGILVHAVDVTDQVVARQMVQQNQERLEKALAASQQLAAIVESSDDSIVSKDLNGLVTSWNQRAEQMFGYTAEEMIGQPILRIIPPELHDDERRILQTIAAGRSIEHFETVRITKGGRRIDVSLTISPVRDEAGRIIGAAKIARDVTKRKQTEQALRMTERLASVGRLAATIAHEMNNPLEALTNLVYLARENTAEPRTHEFLSGAQEELERISLLTRQTLGFYRETRGAKVFTLGALVDQLISAYVPRTRNKKIDLRTEIRSDPAIHGIPGEVRQIIANLLNNSIDAVPTGGRVHIRISAARQSSGNGQRGVRLTVADSGVGIPPEIRRNLFVPFFTTKEETGTGLGLWVSKSIVDKHGGRIALRSCARPGKSWTVFSVFLPQEPRVGALELDLPKSA
ncbi:MAG: ATP-binding protein [Acidobacteriaceae bacterium]